MKWQWHEEIVLWLAVCNIKVFKKSIYSQMKWLQKDMSYRSYASIRSKLNRLRGIK